MSADGAVLALVVEVAAGLDVLLHVDKADSLGLGELALEAPVRIVSCNDDAHAGEDYRKEHEYRERCPQNTVDYLAGRRSVKERAEVHRCAYCNACQRKIHEKVREKRGRKPAAMGAYLHPLWYKVMAIFAFSHDASPLS